MGQFGGTISPAIGLALIFLSGNAYAQSQLDGELYLQTPPERKPVAEAGHNYLPPYGVEPMFQIDHAESHAKTTIYQREVGRWKDPTTLPHTRTQCVKYASGHIPLDGNWRTCVGWKTQSQWLYVTAWIRVQTAKQEEIGSDVNECLQTSAVVGALTAIVSDGSAGVTAFQGAMQGCLASKLSDLVNVDAFTTTAWGDYE